MFALQNPSGHNTQDKDGESPGWVFASQTHCVHNTYPVLRCRNSRVDVRVRISLCSQHVSNSKMQKLQGGRSRYKLLVVTTHKTTRRNSRVDVRVTNSNCAQHLRHKDAEIPGWTFALQTPSGRNTQDINLGTLGCAQHRQHEDAEILGYCLC